MCKTTNWLEKARQHVPSSISLSLVFHNIYLHTHRAAIKNHLSNSSLTAVMRKDQSLFPLWEEEENEDEEQEQAGSNTRRQ